MLVVLLTSSPVTDSTLRLFFILIGSFWAPGRSVPEPRQQSRWRARTGEVKGHYKVKPASDRVTPGPPFGVDTVGPPAELRAMEAKLPRRSTV